MKNKKGYIFLTIIVVIAAIGIYFYRMYNKPHRDVQKTEAAFNINASELFNEFSTNENKATEKYSGQVVIVEGSIMAILYSDTTANIILKTDDDIFGVNCSLLPNKIEQAKSVQNEQLVKIKGECQGIIDDVILNKCAIVK